ncbi:hypothetical protein E2C01_095838 [Portunus trituberculatus]|uniref:Uncharacterized protein n=1 Tax=Portunus trituberculatus TaxID=210409 RepID=A0A5B7JQW5_PORTR|nr:hypothetical protein [Portunus trituberculatus]
MYIPQGMTPAACKHLTQSRHYDPARHGQEFIKVVTLHGTQRRDE